jgi:phage terminase large subunit GpA-like protein
MGDAETLQDVSLQSAALLERVSRREYLAPQLVLSVTEWAERYRVLSSKDSAEPGPYHVERTPYAQEPMDCLSVHSAVQEVVLMWGAQTSKTTVGSNWIGYLADVNPGPVMIVQPTIDMAKRYSRQRLTPMIQESPRLREKVRENRSRDDANTTMLKEFPGGFMAIAGANSAAALRSMPVRDLFTDEEDGYPTDVDGEGDPVQLARARQTTFARRKHLRTSTPTTRGFSRIEAAYAASDRCRYEVPCPHCGDFQPLEWGASSTWGIKWDRTDAGAPLPNSVRYVCKYCGGEIKEHQKPRMLAGGKWVPQAPGAHEGRVRGFHLSSLYSPLGWLSWSTLVTEWHAANRASQAGDASLLRVFVNTRLAETYEEDGEATDQHLLRRRAGSWPLRRVLPGLYVMTLAVDVQADRLHVHLWAWGRGMERQLVDRTAIYGDPSLLESEEGSPWAALTEYRRTPILNGNDKAVPLLAGFVDSGGHHTQAVYTYARAHQHENIYAVKGASTPGRPIIGRASEQDINWKGKKIHRGVKLWLLGVDTAKAEIYGRLRIERPGPGYVHLSKELPPDTFEQLTSERLVTRHTHGRPKLEWVLPAGKRNEDLDCGTYSLAAALWLHIDRWREGDWRKWERRLEREPEPSAAPVVPPKAEEPLPTPTPGVRHIGRPRGRIRGRIR